MNYQNKHVVLCLADWLTLLTKNSFNSFKNYSKKPFNAFCCWTDSYLFGRWKKWLLIFTWALCISQAGADPGIYFGGQTKFSNRKLRAKPESRARRARESRAKLRIEGGARTEGEVWEKTGGGSGGEWARWATPQKLLKNHSWNQSFWCIFEANIWNTWKHAWFVSSRPCSIAHIHEKIDIKYLVFGNCLILLKCKTW